MQAMQLSHWTNLRSAVGACSLGQDGINSTVPDGTIEDPYSHPSPQPNWHPVLPNHPNGHAERKDLQSHWVFGSEHRRASESQHVRSVVFNESLPRCQVLNHAIFRPASEKLAPRSADVNGTACREVKKIKAGPENSDPALLIADSRPQPSTVPGSTLTPGPIVEDTAMRWM
jgi:hypothetical protein